MRPAVGTVLALTAAGLFAVGVILQATVARRAPIERMLRLSLLARLAASRRWLLGTALTIAGWGLQAAALWLAPVTIVQPALATSLIALVVLARLVFQEPLRRREWAGILALTLGIAMVAALAPPRSPHHVGGVGLVGCIGGLAVVAVSPLVWRRAGRRRAALVAVAAGVAYSLSAIATKLATDAPPGSRAFAWSAAWLSLVLAAGVVGGVSEMSALRARQASVVVPLLVGAETLVPVALAPFVFGERWTAFGAAQGAALVLALAVTLAGMCALAASPGVARLAPGGSSAEPPLGSDAARWRIPAA